MNKDMLKDRFLELRISGETFESIANTLKVSKQTLISWSKEDLVKDAVDTARIIKHQKILQTYGQHRDAKIEYYSNLIKKLKDELLKRDFSNLPSEKLLSVILICENELRKVTFIQVFGGDDILKFATTESSFIFNPED